jgi:hypothetical protein
LVPPGFQLGNLFLEAINVSSSMGLSPVESPGVQKQWGSEPMAREVEDRGCQQCSDAPVPSQDSLHVLVFGKGSDRNLDDEIQDALHDRIGQGKRSLGFGPHFCPDSPLVGEAKGQIAAAPLQIEAEAIGLA